MDGEPGEDEAGQGDQAKFDLGNTAKVGAEPGHETGAYAVDARDNLAEYDDYTCDHQRSSPEPIEIEPGRTQHSEAELSIYDPRRERHYGKVRQRMYSQCGGPQPRCSRSSGSGVACCALSGANRGGNRLRRLHHKWQQHEPGSMRRGHEE